ncbi:MAG: NifU family protein [Cyclobacteriaceae bacterium]|nr:NifU family protein [Cyclobacteriaceae bacterium]
MNIQTEAIEELTKRIEESLNTIRPYLEADGGNVKINEVTSDNIVKLEFIGACGNCPMSTMTFKAGVEEAIKKAVPEIKSIEVINLTPVSH